MTITEVWKPIKNYEGLYEISNLGRVKSLGNKSNHLEEKLLYLNHKKDGYVNVTIQKNKKAKTYRVHRLVAETFIPNPDGKKVVNHKDYNRSNNAADNLEWTTTKENYNYSMCHQPKIRRTRSDNASGERYICWHSNKKKYQVLFKGGRYGDFANLEDAIKRRDEVLDDYEKAHIAT